jgi:hypothetical protein
MEVTLCSTTRERGLSDNVDILFGDRSLGTCEVARVMEDRKIEVVLGPEFGERFDIQLRRRTGCREGGESGVSLDGAVFLKRIRFGYINEASPSPTVRFGTVGGQRWLREGFWHNEYFAGGVVGRWTKGRAKVCLPMSPPRGDAVITLALTLGLRPAEAGAVGLRVSCNGHPVDLVTQSTDAATGVSVQSGPIPMAWLSVSNDVEIACNPWHPSDYGSPDIRELGVVIHSIGIETKPSGTGVP